MTKFEKEKNGFYRTTVTNVPAYREEPRMPPEDEVRKWMLLYYTAEKKASMCCPSRLVLVGKARRPALPGEVI